MLKKPELLAPAGNIEKAMLAFHYGADAVFVGGTVFGLRKYADNFQLDELKECINLANKLNKHVYLVLNAFAHNSDVEPIITYLKECERIQPHAFIISDLGVARLANQYTSIPIHVSTQASITNVSGCEFWQQFNAKRVILAREVTIEECKLIKNNLNIECEVFIHGAQCASYSGKCVISNYAAGRDSNRGGCVQSCRHQYRLLDPETKQDIGSTHIMNAKDLIGVQHCMDAMKAGIESLKIEGRMKSNLYVANAVNVYRQVIDYVHDCLINRQEPDLDTLIQFEDQLNMVSNRSFSSGGLANRPAGDSINYHFSQYNKHVQYVGMIRDIDDVGRLVCDVKSGFNSHDKLSLVQPNYQLKPISNWSCFDSLANPIECAKPNTVIRIKSAVKAKRYGLIVREI